MGIQGLLPFLKKIHTPVNVSQFAGCTAAIDAYCWLHKGAFSCAEKLALGEKTDQYVTYCMKFVNMLLNKNIKPIMVFDGCHLPSKKNVEKSRREKRDLNRKKAAQFLREGKRAEARECLQRSIDISPEMALELMNVCRQRGVDCIVAPYEADAQLAYLNKIGVAQIIITEDSDLLLFGCEKVIFKMDHAGSGLLIEQQRLNEVMEIQTGHYTFEKFRYMCILSGCDYLASLPGIGLARANKVFKIARQSDITLLLKKLSTYLKSNVTANQEYIDGFVAANNTFLYQLVFDPLQRKLVPLNPYTSDCKPDEMQYAGSYMPDSKALDLALGNINIYTRERFADFDPDTFVPKYVKKKPESLHQLSMWDRNYRIRPKSALREPQQVDRPNLKGKEVTVKARFRRSPQKRQREVPEDKQVKTTSELSSLYGSVTPTKKRMRLEDIEDGDIHRFLSVPTPEKAASQSDSEDDHVSSEPVRTGPIRSPRFFNSLRNAHPELSPMKNQIEEQEEPDEKENSELLKSPSRNRFACRSPSKRPRFNLNAKKEVKSRFFSSSTNKSTEVHNSASAGSTKKDCEVAGYSFVHSNTETEHKSKPKTSPFTFSKSKANRCITDWTTETSSSTKSQENSPEQCKSRYSFGSEEKSATPKSGVRFKGGTPNSGSAFSWNKFKFSRKNSTDSLPDFNSSKAVSGKFKRVISDMNLEKFNELPSSRKVEKDEHDENENSELIDAVLNKSETSAKNDIDAVEFMSSAIQVKKEISEKYECDRISSSPNRFDPDYDSAQDSPNLGSQTSGSSKEGEYNTDSPVSHLVSDVIDLVDSGSEDALDFSQSQASTSQSLSDMSSKVGSLSRSSSKKGTLKSGCRVSGLSRKSKKSPKVSTNTGKQQSLKDMFSKFAHQKSEADKLLL